MPRHPSSGSHPPATLNNLADTASTSAFLLAPKPNTLTSYAAAVHELHRGLQDRDARIDALEERLRQLGTVIRGQAG